MKSKLKFLELVSEEKSNTLEKIRNRRKEKLELKEAISKITKELKNDAGYRESWKANIAMAYKDCEHWYKQKTGKKQLNREDKHIIANDAAEHFLKLLCDEYQFGDDK